MPQEKRTAYACIIKGAQIETKTLVVAEDPEAALDAVMKKFADNPGITLRPEDVTIRPLLE